MIVGIDVGRSEVKYYSNGRKGKFKSEIGEWRERKLINENCTNNYEISINSKKYFVADLAIESRSRRKMASASKIHDETKILLLTAAGLLAPPGASLRIVTGLPIEQHTPEIKAKLVELIKGNYQVKVAGRKTSFTISDVAIAPEGCAAFWDEVLSENGKSVTSSLSKGKTRFIDIGSRTVNIGTLYEGRFIDRLSKTLPYGLGELFNSGRNLSDEQKSDFTRKIIGDISWVWQEDFDPQSDNIILVGGGSKFLEVWLKEEYPCARISSDPVFSNARGFFKMGQLRWPEK